MADVTLTIDGKKVTVPQGTTVLQAAETMGVKVPHYCYHPGLSIAGNCRMCLIEVEKAPKPLIGCQTQVAEGMVVHTETDNVKKMRQSVMEFLLINHPLDCPTCDQAGECRLQDYYMDYDVNASRFKEIKVHKDKMVNLGAGVMLDQERCVACTRCIRFCQEVAGEDELALANRGDHVTITTFPGKEMSNPYAGNVVDICPVGALTSKDFRYQKRVWFLSKTPSICPGCSRGCNTEMHHADSQIYRLIPRENMDVNQYWMCDEGRYGYQSVNQNRVLRPLVKKDGQANEVTYQQAVEQLVQEMSGINTSEIAVVGHAWQTCESLESLKEFAATTLNSSLLFACRNEPENPSSDDVLRTADKNPNQKTVDDLGFKPLAQLDKAKAALVVNDLSEADLAILQQKNIPILVLWAVNHHPAMDKASVVLPHTTYAEEDGHFVNCDGRKQKITQAFKPRGESKSLSDSLIVLKSVLTQQTTQASA